MIHNRHGYLTRTHIACEINNTHIDHLRSYHVRTAEGRVAQDYRSDTAIVGHVGDQRVRGHRGATGGIQSDSARCIGQSQRRLNRIQNRYSSGQGSCIAVIVGRSHIHTVYTAISAAEHRLGQRVGQVLVAVIRSSVRVHNRARNKLGLTR